MIRSISSQNVKFGRLLILFTLLSDIFTFAVDKTAVLDLPCLPVGFGKICRVFSSNFANLVSVSPHAAPDDLHIHPIAGKGRNFPS